MILTDYLSLIPSQHKDKPNFMAMTSADVAPYEKLQNILTDIPNLYDVNLAVGAQLDIIGEWVGLSRVLTVPLTISAARYDSSLNGGWDVGVYFNEFDPITTISILGDEEYRFYLILKIAQNRFDGRVETAYSILEALGVSALIVDNQDMTMTIAFASTLSKIEQALLLDGSVNLKPVGVGVQYVQVILPLGIYDSINSASIGGWGSDILISEVALISALPSFLDMTGTSIGHYATFF